MLERSTAELDCTALRGAQSRMCISCGRRAPVHAPTLRLLLRPGTLGGAAERRAHSLCTNHQMHALTAACAAFGVGALAHTDEEP